jgi:hypothetical protein
MINCMFLKFNLFCYSNVFFLNQVNFELFRNMINYFEWNQMDLFPK